MTPVIGFCGGTSETGSLDSKVEQDLARRGRAWSGRDNPDTSLLLNPFERDLDPSEHLRFDEHGNVFDRNSARGWETIRTCRLDRLGLIEQRRERAMKVVRILGKLVTDSRTKSRGAVREALKDLAELGAQTVPHAGMLRVMVQHETGLSWAQLMAYLEVP